MNKEKIADILEEIGTLLELKGENPFKTRAYHNAARMIQNSTEDFEKLAKTDQLDQLPGIGEALAKKIAELVTTGKLKYLEELKKEFPPHLTDLLKISGLGPKKVKILYQDLGISSIGELEYACKENRLLKQKGFGEKTQKNILKEIEYQKKNQGSYLYPVALKAAEEFLLSVQKISGIRKISIGGSLRRCKEIVHDIDLIASADADFKKIMLQFTHLEEVETILAEGETKSSVRLKSGIQVDFRVVEEKQFPYALIYFTGNKDHNTILRGMAKDLGIKLNEYGLFKGEKNIVCHDEKEIYEKLGLHFIPPEAREGIDEIEWAKKHSFPELIEEKDIQGVFHVHSLWSDGSAEIEAMAQKAESLGFQYLGLSDHSQSAKYAGGLTPDDIKKQHAEIDLLNKKNKKIKIFKGIESDILSDGSLDYPENVLEKFDFVIASVHSGFKMNEEEMTKRLIKALKNPYTTMLGHMTGRLLLAREGYKLDLEKIFETAAKNNKMIEINANPHRFDIDWRYLKMAKEKGVKFSINPDAHSIEGLEDTFLGVGIARKGWLTKKEVVNTMSLKEIEKYLFEK